MTARVRAIIAAARAELSAEQADEVWWFRHQSEQQRRREYEIELAEAKDAIGRPFLEHIDAGWDGEGWAPSDLLLIGYGVHSSAHHGWGRSVPTSAQAEARAERFLTWAKQHARDLWRAGFHANPFTNDPQRRAA